MDCHHFSIRPLWSIKVHVKQMNVYLSPVSLLLHLVISPFLLEVPSVTIPQNICHQSHTVPSWSPLKSNYCPPIWILSDLSHVLERKEEKFPIPVRSSSMCVCDVVCGVNLHQLCLTNSINHPSEKSIGCIMAHISQ